MTEIVPVGNVKNQERFVGDDVNLFQRFDSVAKLQGEPFFLLIPDASDRFQKIELLL